MNHSNEIRAPDDWDTHWGEFAEAVTANPAQIMRHGLVLDLCEAEQFPRNGKFLDIGSGQGDFLAKFHQRFPEINLLGFELSETGVEMSRRKLPSARFVAADLFAPPSSLSDYEEWADAAICSEVLEHVDDPVLFLRAAKKYLKDGATLLVTVPGGPMSAFDRFIGHRRQFDRESIRRVLEGAGFEVKKVMLAGFPFFNLYRLMVMARGEKFAGDLQKRERSKLVKGLMNTMSKIVEVFFRMNFRNSPFGWQVVAVARNVLGPASLKHKSSDPVTA